MVHYAIMRVKIEYNNGEEQNFVCTSSHLDKIREGENNASMIVVSPPWSTAGILKVGAISEDTILENEALRRN